MAKWKQQFEFLDIEYLRSPIFFHPDPYVFFLSTLLMNRADAESLKAYADAKEGKEGKKKHIRELSDIFDVKRKSVRE